MNESSPFPSRPLKAYAAIAKGALWLLLTVWLVLVLAWGALHVWIVPRIGELRSQLESEATRAIGVPVRIGAVSARSDGLFPSFELSDVSLLDAQGREALRLARVRGALSPRSLWNLGLEQLYIERPELDIRRTAEGRILVAGLDFSRASPGEGGAADWFFRQTEFALRNGTIRWTDEMNAAPPLALGAVDFVVRNSGRRHALRLDATPPPEWGDRFSLQGVFREPLLSRQPGAWQTWVGQLHGDFQRVDVSQLRRYASLGIEVTAGHGAVRAWADVRRGELVGGTADVVLADVNTRLSPRLEPLALQSISGRLGGKRMAGGFELQTEGVQFVTREGQRWPGGNLFLSWAQADGGRPAHGELRADKLDLDSLSQIAARLPIGDATHSALAAYAPKGLVETVRARWQGPVDAMQSYEAKGRAVGVEVAARPAAGASAESRRATPGIRGATIDFDMTQAGGRGRLRINRGALDLPGVFEDPVLPVDELSAALQWKIDGPSLSVSVAELRFSNADAQGEGRIDWHTGNAAARFPGVLDLQASIGRANGARVWRYLPLGVAKPARDYVQAAVLQGFATGARFRVKGDLNHFPFKDPKRGEFLITANVHDVTYAFVPPGLNRAEPIWPALTQLSGTLVFERNGMQVKNAAGRFSTGPALQVRTDAQIPDFGQTQVAVTAQVRGPLTQALAVVNTSPVSSMLGHALAKTTAGGNADVHLKLQLPIAGLDKSRVEGNVMLAGNDIQFTPETPLLTRARGAVSFSERGFTLVGAQARALGGDVRMDGGTRTIAAGSSSDVSIRAQGTATAEGLRQARELGVAARLARDASGSAAYSLGLTFRAGVPEILVTSSLQGLALNLPAPLGKAADTALPLRYENTMQHEPAGATAAGAPAGDRILLEVGRIASIAYERDIRNAEPVVLRGAIAVGLAPGEAAPLPAQGVMANINLTRVDLDAWGAVLDRAAGAAAATGAISSLAGGASAAMGYLPTVMAVRTKELTLQGRTLHNVVVGGSRDGQTWRANVDATELNGYAEYRQPSASGAGRLHARLARLSIAASAAKEVETLLDEQPDRLPALDVVVEEFDLFGKKLGRLEIDAVNRGAIAGDARGREWRLNKLNLLMPEAEFSATGNWAAVGALAPEAGRMPAGAVPERRRTAMKFRLDISDAGLLLARFGMKDVVRRGKGRMEGQVAWLGSPLALNYGSMDGSFYANVESGQFLKAEPGLAKLLGVLSLQSLPRRLVLDFRDVFSEGFAFDFLRGDVTIEDGIAASNNLQMKGVNAAVLMEGKADIARETQDLKVVVVPEINAGTASLVASVINPAIGLGTFLAQMVLREPLIRAATQEFHVDGTWAEPRITRVARRPAELRTGSPDTAPRAQGVN